MAWSRLCVRWRRASPDRMPPIRPLAACWAAVLFLPPRLLGAIHSGLCQLFSRHVARYRRTELGEAVRLRSEPACLVVVVDGVRHQDTGECGVGRERRQEPLGDAAQHGERAGAGVRASDDGAPRV